MPKARNQSPSASRKRRNHRASQDTLDLVLALLNWFAQNARDLPWRKTQDPYSIWVSEIMLQQTQVKTVIPYWERWMRELPSIQSLAEAPLEKIHKLWEGLGYYSRVRNLQKGAQEVVRKYNGIFPAAYEDVLELPGIGRYTAGAICSIAFNQSTAILDGNVIRVLTRAFGIGENPEEKQTNERLWNLAGELVGLAGRAGLKNDLARHCCSHFNQSLMELGALVCTPRNPGCDRCPISALCVARSENRVELLPRLEKRAPATVKRMAAFIVRREQRYLVCQRPGGGVNAHLWEFPSIELSSATARQTWASPFILPKDAVPFATIKHSITRYRITLEAFHARLNVAGAVSIHGTWLTMAGLTRLPFSSAHKKILLRLQQDDGLGQG